MPDLPEIQSVAAIDIDIDIDVDMSADMSEMINTPIEIDIPTPIQEIEIQMPVDLPEIVEVEPIQEIQEISIEEPVTIDVETTVETPEELVTEDTHDKDIKESATNEPEQERETEIAKNANRIIKLKDGQILTDEKNQ